MTFVIKDSLTEEELRVGLRNVIRDGLTSQAMVTLTGGVFLVAFALKLGASNVAIGLLAAIPPMAQLLQIPSVYVVEKYRARRTITFWSAASSRLFWLFIAAIPFFISARWGLAALIAATLLQSSLGAVGGSSWNSWMHDLVPKDRLGVFFSKRMSLAMAVSIPLSLGAGLWIDHWNKIAPQHPLFGYSALFFMGFLAGMLGVYFISTIPEPLMASSDRRPGMLAVLKQPFHDANFKNLLMFLGPWNFAVNLAAPFFAVYMLRILHLSISLIIGLTVLSQLVHVIFFRVWGKISDRLSNKSVLGVSGPLFALCVLAWVFTTFPEKHAFTLPLLILIHILMGISMAGVTLASGNISLKFAPQGQATAYLATSSVVNSLAAGFAPILGGILVDLFAHQELSMLFRWTNPARRLGLQTFYLKDWDFLFLTAFLLGLYSIHRLALVRESGEVEEKIVVSEMIAETRRVARNLSTIGGLRSMTQFPFAVIQHIKGKQRPSS